MEIRRSELVDRVSNALGGRSLVYFGSRGADAEAFVDLPQLRGVACINAPLSRPDIPECSLETIRLHRLDTDRYSIDEAPQADRRTLLAALCQFLDGDAAIVPFRPNHLLAAAFFPNRDRVLFLGNSHVHQRALEYKPWVETELHRIGVPTLPWQYISTLQLDRLAIALGSGPLVVRSPNSEGGTGLRLVETLSDVTETAFVREPGFIAATPLLPDAVPAAVNACVFRDGRVSFHGIARQIVGLPFATTRKFGYCGNDFASPGRFRHEVLDRIEEITRTVGRWLRSLDYLGVYGIDFLIERDRVYFVELNPRFLGSSPVAALMDQELDRPDIYLSHLAAFLDLGLTTQTTVRELAERQPAYSHVICHNVSGSAMQTLPETTTSGRMSPAFKLRLVPGPGVAVDREGILLQTIHERSISEDGPGIDSRVESEIRNELRARFKAASTESPS